MGKNFKLKGFTLIELIIVVAIIALLASLALPQYNKAKLNAVVAAHNANVQTIKSAAIMADTSSDKTVTNYNEEVLKYIEGGKLPEIPGEILGSTNGWSITKDSNNNFVITPGIMKVKDGKIEPKDK